MKDLFDKIITNKGPLGKYAKIAEGYFAFPKLEGPIGNRMIFNGKEVITWSVNDYLGLANHSEVRETDSEAAKKYGSAYPMGARLMSGHTELHEKLENDYITYLNDLRVQVELLRKSLENYSEIIPINQSVVASAEEDLKLVQERYSLGSATILEVLDAQVSLIRSNSTLINTVHDARIKEMNLNAILGILDLKYLTEEE